LAIIMGTAGHIDHGKSSLVKALTHVDPDRLQEEKKRGMSIELGFCPFTSEISVIDVPGHERFIRTMASGIHAIDLALFVVAANEGIMPQSLEHRDICDVLDIPLGILLAGKLRQKFT
jgi:selenocysteine-specific elongation factor